MDISQFNPYVRYIDKRHAVTEYKDFVAAYDHRLFFVLSGSLEISLENGSHTTPRRDSRSSSAREWAISFSPTKAQNIMC